MDRKLRILFSALGKHDRDTLDCLQVPVYESTKGTHFFERDVFLARKHVLEELYQNDLLKHDGNVSPTHTIQIGEVSSTEKVHATRLQCLNTKKVPFSSNNSNYTHDFNKSADDISSTMRESDSGEDNDSGDEFIPKPEDECDSDTNSSDSQNLDLREQKETYLTDASNKQEISPTYRKQKLDENYKKRASKDKMDPALEFPSRLITEKVSNSGKKRIWNKRDHCYYCYDDVTKFSRHVLRHHQNETKVQEILALKVGDKKRKYLFNKLRNEGNFIKSSCEENVVPIRKPVGNIEQPTQFTYLPCKYCKGFYKKRALYRHVKNCAHNDGMETGKTLAQSEGQSLLSTYKCSDTLRKEVFPKMRADNVSFVAKTDRLICAVAARYLKSHKDKHFYLVASRKMRQLATLLIEIRKQIKVKSLQEALDPTYYDNIVASTKAIAKFDSKSETYGVPSLASNMGTQLKECIDVAYNMLLKKFRTETEFMKNLKSLKDLISSEWQYDVSTIANRDLSQKKWNKPSLIPLAEDLTLLRSYLLSEAEKYRNALEINPEDEKAYKILQEICYVQLLLLNRRRAGELQRITVHTYITHINDYKSSEFDNCISESEKILMKSFKRVVIKGKRGRGVPVLFTEDMVKSIDVLLKNRDHSMTQNNIYLFGNIKSASSISGTKAMYKHVRLAGVKNAAALTSTKLRKHLATMSQVINLSEQDLEQLAIFMGHTSDIHKAYYRLPSDVYQMAKVSKLVLLNEKGEAAKFKGMRLDEIDINLDPIDEEPEEPSGDENEDTEETTGYSLPSNENKDVPSTSNKQMTATNCTALEKTTKVKRRILEPWKEAQKIAAVSFFKDHIRKKLPPKKNECLILKEENPETFSNKSWQKIKIFIVNMYKKM